jgi:outer membrane immunogenic protein
MKRHLNQLAVGLAVVGGATFASIGLAQADGYTPGRVAYERPYLWTGFYFGAHVGAAQTTAKVIDVDGYNSVGGVTHESNDPNGFAGLHAGFNLQLQKVVVGIEGEVGVMGLNGHGQWAPFIGVRSNLDSFASFGMDGYATIAGRAGFLATDRLLIYGKAGWGGVQTHVSFIDQDPTGITLTGGTIVKKDLTGMVWGGGLEYAFGHRVTAKLEYLHFDIGETIRETATSTGVPANPRFDHRIGDVDTIKLGLSIKLDPVRDVAPLK